MTRDVLMQCLLMSIGAQLLDLLLIQIPQLRKKAAAANKPFSLKEWWNSDWNIILATQVIIIIVTIGYRELVGFSDVFSKYARWIYAGIGGFGSSIAMANWSSYNKLLTKLFSVKSNIADVMTGGTTTVSDTIKKGSEAVGQDVSINPENKTTI